MQSAAAERCSRPAAAGLLFVGVARRRRRLPSGEAAKERRGRDRARERRRAAPKRRAPRGLSLIHI
eukprot:2193935-Prymnesium_polylepis.1